MLNKNRRITKELFGILVKEGKNIHSDNVYLRFCKTEEVSKFSFVVSSKVFKNATDRNLFKRRGRHIVKKQDSNLKEGYLCAFFAKNSNTNRSFVDLEKEFVFLLTKSDILKNQA